MDDSVTLGHLPDRSDTGRCAIPVRKQPTGVKSTRLTALFAHSGSGPITCARATGAAASFALALAVALAPVNSAVAVPVHWLYDVDVPVEGRTAAARLAVSGAALLEVLSRVSGLAHVPRNARVLEALDRPEAYYNRFVFLDNNELRIQFTPGAILQLMDEARLPVWSANRPQAVAWLVVERGGVRRVIDGEHPLAATLSGRARQRGVVLKLPLMDLEDRMLVQPAVVRGRLFSPLDEASGRYGADVILAGQVQERVCVSEPPEGFDPEARATSQAPAGPDFTGDFPEPSTGPAAAPPGGEVSAERAATSTDEPSFRRGPARHSDSEPEPDKPAEQAPASGLDSSTGLESPVAETPQTCGPAGGLFYSGALQAWMDGEEFAGEFAVSDVTQAGLMTVDFLADELAGRFAVLARQPNSVGLTIVGIDSPVGYGRLLGYLEDLEFVSSVDVSAVQAGRLEITLHTRAGLEQLVELFESDGRMRPDPANEAVLIWRGP